MVISPSAVNKYESQCRAVKVPRNVETKAGDAEMATDAAWACGIYGLPCRGLRQELAAFHQRL